MPLDRRQGADSSEDQQAGDPGATTGVGTPDHAVEFIGVSAGGLEAEDGMPLHPDHGDMTAPSECIRVADHGLFLTNQPTGAECAPHR